MKKEKIYLLCKKEILSKEINFYGSIENPYFLPSDIASWLGITNSRQMLKSADLSEEQKGVFLVDTLGGEQEKVFITEDGLYDTLMASRKPESRPLKKEIKSYLKQIRLTGGYIPVSPEDTDELIMARALKIADKTIQEKDVIIQEYQKKIETLKPDADMANDIIKRNGLLTLKQVSDTIEIGRTKLCSLLRQKMILSKQSGYNEPMGKYIKSSYFKTVVEEDERTKHVSVVTLVTPKGLRFIYRLIKKNELLDDFDATLLIQEVNQNA